MRDATNVDERADKPNDTGRSFLRACAVILAVGSFIVQSVQAQAQSIDPVTRNITKLTNDGTFGSSRATNIATNRSATAKLVAERIDDLVSHPASRADVEALRELIGALKDELDAANIRIDRLQERLDSAIAVPRAVPQVAPDAHVGAPLDPLSAVFARGSVVAARIWGTTQSAMALALAGLDHSFVTSEVDSAYLASLDPTVTFDAHDDVAAALFGRSSLAPSLVDEIALRPWVPDVRTTQPVTAHVAMTVQAKRDSAVSQRSADVGTRIATVYLAGTDVVPMRVPDTRLMPVVAARLSARVAASVGTLLATTQTNAEFDRALRAASELSGAGSDMPAASAYPIFSAFDRTTLSNVGSAYRGYSPSTRTASAGTVTVPLKLGRTRLVTKTSLQHMEQANADAVALPATAVAQNRLHYDAAAVDTSFVVPAFHKAVTINVRGGYDRLHSPDTSTLPYYPTDASATNYELPSGGAPNADASVTAAAANGTNVERYTYGATAAVPVTHTIKVGVGYSSQHLSGTYGVSSGIPIDRKDAYAGSLTYAPHDGKSSVTIAGREYRYSDDSAPNSGFKETRGDVLFSVKF